MAFIQSTYLKLEMHLQNYDYQFVTDNFEEKEKKNIFSEGSKHTYIPRAVVLPIEWLILLQKLLCWNCPIFIFTSS